MYTKEKPVELRELLAAKERRADRQRSLLAEYRVPLISFSMNLAGEIKRFPLSDLLFQHAVSQITGRLGSPVHQETVRAGTGLEAIFIYREKAEELKRFCLELEEKLPAGRLLDLDVLDADGRKLEREIPRRCLLCSEPAAACARSRAHGLDAVKARTEELLREAAPAILADYAVDALLEEVRLTPKPGLVDQKDSGAHSDMTLALFEKSAEALRPYFRFAAACGMEDPDCMKPLQEAGREAERVMYAATGGVNTHKGAIYAFGLILAAAGSCLVREDDLFLRAAALARAGKTGEEESHGSALRKAGLKGGARAEAEAGFPTARIGLAALESRSGTDALMEIILACRDSNLLWRGGEEGLSFARSYATRVLAAEGAEKDTLLAEMNREMIARRLSPGGSADLLALAMLLRKVKGVIL